MISTGDKLWIVFEYLEKDLKMFVDNFPKEKIPLTHIKTILKQILQGLAYIHMEGIIHRDLKPQNILISSDKDFNKIEVKLADFGLARTFSQLTKNLTKNTSKFLA